MDKFKKENSRTDFYVMKGMVGKWKIVVVLIVLIIGIKILFARYAVRKGKK